MIVNKLKRNDLAFPQSLREIHQPPLQIYWAGAELTEWLHLPKVAVVGSRKMTGYGRLVTEKIVAELSAAGVVIISGLAYGVDVTAHRAALAAGGTTVAVLPAGIGNIYPAVHSRIAEQIAANGSLVSEYVEAATIAFKSNFIARNRLISGLADIVLITEAAINSGSLHTARFALEQGKTVMAVPGNINSPGSEGCNNLIKSGAVPVTSASDILFSLKIPSVRVDKKRFFGTSHEEMIYKLIEAGTCRQEELAAASGINAPSVSSALTMLELAGHVRPTGGGNWAII